MAAQIEILSEREIPAGWAFDAQLLDEDGRLHPLSLTLAWADFNLWSPDGADEPQKVAEAVLSYLVSQIPIKEIRTNFDAALIRRMFADADEKIPGFIQRSL